MTAVEERILKNQFEIMWTLHYLLKCSAPDLVGRGGQLDRMLDDLVVASKDTQATISGEPARGLLPGEREQVDRSTRAILNTGSICSAWAYARGLRSALSLAEEEGKT